MFKKDKINKLLDKGLTAREIAKKGFNVGQVYKLAAMRKQKPTKVFTEKSLEDALAEMQKLTKDRGEVLAVKPTRMFINPRIMETIKDVINSPDHYTEGGIETIDFIEAKQANYHVGNAIKYLSRARFKGDYIENIRKAKWYIDREISRYEYEASNV